MPNVWELGEEGVLFENSFTCQPVCGPARACLQTGQYATENKCYWNGIPLPENTKSLADYFNENGYDTAYILALAGIDVPESYSGNVLPVNDMDGNERDCVFIQISESHIGRAVRTKNWKYSAKAIGSGWYKPRAVHYFDDFLYDLKNDPCEKNNLVNDENYGKILQQMHTLLAKEMVNSGEKKPRFHKRLK